jgi:choline dehydrogenase-like flavoprotein
MLDEHEDDGLRIQYTIRAELRERTAHLRTLLSETLKDRHMTFLSHDIELNYGHPCGTCVMNDNPSAGVVDRDCRAHGIDNLFIVDASFMPSSAACNPSLTVAANALRVSTVIHRGIVASGNVAEPARV